MIRLVRRFLGFSWQEQWICVEAFCLTGVTRLVILLLPFRWMSMVLGKHMQESPIKEGVAEAALAGLIGWGVETVSRYTPWESKCLVQAIVGKMMLRQYGIANTLYLGVGRDAGNSLVAHAWLRCGDTIITGRQGRERFTMVGKFADHMNTKEMQKGGDTI
ncbi:lasso peptide biosynthesis B2 protein [Sporomusa malonica]|uniref:lasso peptide biosynthesis B2 protein n=1 Tax=Sporomusa malonica TaxID=112901 RepID=UPI000A021E37|nr:lasso peptide biosynthesis B2 protein [Sporomusa malonica]